MKKKILISIPAYNEANNIRPLYKKLNETLEEKREEFTIQDLIYFGLSADPKAKVRRELLGKELRIGYGNANQVLSRLNNYGITKEEFVKAIEKIEKMI